MLRYRLPDARYPTKKRDIGRSLIVGAAAGLGVLVTTWGGLMLFRASVGASARPSEPGRGLGDPEYGGVALEVGPGAGRNATNPARIPKRGWMAVLKRTYKESKSDYLGLVSAGVAFYGFLAITPLLASIVLLYGLVFEPSQIVGQIEALGGMIPADAADLVRDQLVPISATAAEKSLLGLVLALGLAVFSAMKGAGAVITALNVVYEQEETRGFIRKTLTRAGLTLGALVLAVTVLIAGTLSVWLEAKFAASAGIGVRLLAWLIAGVLASGFVAVVYRYGPDRRPARWSWLTPGSVLAVTGIMIATLGFGLYASYVGKFNATYGSLGAVIAVLTWLFFSAYVLLMGAELNAELEHQTARDTTVGPEKPLGARDAVMADTVAPEAST